MDEMNAMVNTPQSSSRRQPSAWVMLLVVFVGLAAMGYLAFWLLHGPSVPQVVDITTPAPGNHANPTTQPQPKRGGRGGKPMFPGGWRGIFSDPDGVSLVNGGKGGYRIKYDKLIFHVPADEKARPDVTCFVIWASVIDPKNLPLLTASQKISFDANAARAVEATPDQVKRLGQILPARKITDADQAHLKEAVAAYKQAPDDAKAEAEKGVLAIAKKIEGQYLPNWKTRADDGVAKVRQILSSDQLSKFQDYLQGPPPPGRPASSPSTGPTTR